MIRLLLCLCLADTPHMVVELNREQAMQVAAVLGSEVVFKACVKKRIFLLASTVMDFYRAMRMPFSQED